PDPPKMSMNAKVPMGLPINCYDRGWYDSLHVEEHRLLKIDKTNVYPFTNSP
ncbi:hypothetical protein M404DRAFT_164079, partial [Pisolithus tinctorius Marx 270]